MAKIGALSVDLSLETQNFLQSIKDSQEAVKQFDKDVRPLTKTLDDMGESMKGMGQTLSIGLTLPIVAMGAAAVKQFSDSAESVALLENVIKSTGGAAGKTAEQLQKMATNLQGNSLFEDDEIIRKVINQLLTFTNVSGEAFDRGAQAAMNMSTVLGQDLQSSAIQVGKALNDPIAGVTALRRVGVQLTDDQKNLIKSFQDVGDVAGAQKVILDELEKEFGGAAEAASKAGTGPFKQLQIQIGNLSEAFGKIIVEALIPLAGYLSTAVTWIDGLSDGWKTAIVVVAGVLASLGPVLLVLGSMATGLASLIGLWGTVSVAVSAAGGIFAALGAALGPVIAVLTGPVGIIALVAAAAGGIIYFAAQTEAGQELIGSAWSAIKSVATEVWGAITATVSAAAASVATIWSENKGELSEIWDSIEEAASAFWYDFGPFIIDAVQFIKAGIGVQLDGIKLVWVLVWGEIKAVASAVWDGIKGTVSGGLDIIKGVVEVATGILTLNWSKFAEGFGDIWSGIWKDMATIVKVPLNLVIDTVKNFVSSIGDYLKDIIGTLDGLAKSFGLDSLSAKLEAASKWLDTASAGTKKVNDEITTTNVAIEQTSAVAASAVSSHWGKSSTEIAAAQKKLREDESKANDTYYKSLEEFYKNQRSLGLISNDDLVRDLIFAETNRYALEDHSDGNLQALAAQHEAKVQKIRQDGATAQAAIDLAQQHLEEGDIKQMNAIREAAENALINNAIAVYTKKWQLGQESGAVLRDQLIYFEDRKWEALVLSGKATEALEIQHQTNILDIKAKYAQDGLAIDEGVEAMRKFMQENDVKEQSGIYDDMHARTVIQAKDELKVWTEHQKDVNALGKQIDHEWQQSMNNLAGGTSAAIVKMVDDWDFNAGALVDISKRTAESMLNALIKGLITPFTNSLADLGTSLTKSLLGIGGTGGSGGIGGLLGGLGGSNGGGILGALGGLFKGGTGAIDLSGVGDATGTVFSVPGTSGGALGGIGSFLSSTTGLATLGIGAAVGGVISWIKSQAHHEADDLVDNIQAPFDTNFASLVDMVTNEFNAGTQNQRDLVIAQVGMHELWTAVNATVEQWRTAKGNSSDRNKVASQFHGTEDAFVSTQLKWIDDTAKYYFWNNPYRDGTLSDSEASQLPHYAMGTPWVPQDGLAYLHRGEAVIPASRNAGSTATMNVAPVYNITLGSGGSSRRDDIGELKWILKNNTQGIAEAVARAVRDMAPGLVTA